MQQDNPLKPGMKTTEFLSVVISMGVSTAVLFKVIPAEQAVHFQDQILQFCNLILQLMTLLAALGIMLKPVLKYIEGRVQLKTQALQNQQATTQPTA